MKYFLLVAFPFVVSFSADEGRKVDIEHAFSATTKDSILLEVNLVYDTADLPAYYQCWVLSPVCDDGLCRLVELDVHWDLLGNYRRFVVPEGKPLTKWDHLEFTEDDYLKLHEILGDERSLLGTVSEVGDLFEQDTKKVSEKVDAVTGATKETVKKAVVDGAVYSSYTLWHLVHGEISDGISSRVPDIVNDDLLSKFLRSDHYPYQYYAVDYLVDHGEITNHLDELQHMLRRADSFVARATLKEIVGVVHTEKRFQMFLVDWLKSADYYTQQSIFKTLSSNELYPEVLESLTSDTDPYNERQMLQIIDIVDRQYGNVSRKTLKNLNGFISDERQVISDASLALLGKLADNDAFAKKILKKYENN